ncbi:DUF4442 domain-containing protein [Aquimarina litoralis]|uniref:DUF4442 domain-containing protein n=1 Tax=Aquimarina litoralis TaxID=584605 RepID=UPI001C566DC4|nr:DUF4442 domain-containing protein [Aquimarina litoralis]MBW1297403.1 DUF4442 domain-containing protein [Aquimarina litoralis]
MSIYQSIAKLKKYVGVARLFKYGFNFSPMYRRSTGRITEVSKDLHFVKIKLPISYKNKNYVNSIYGGSLFSAVDPIPMVQLINIIGNDYVVWDKYAEIYFKRPARENLYAEFEYTEQEVTDIIQRVKENNEIEIEKHTLLTNKEKTKTYCEVRKTIYVADKAFYKQKKNNRKS